MSKTASYQSRKDRNVIRRQVRKRQPFPTDPVKLPRPKQVPDAPGGFTWLNALPMLAMALITGGLAYWRYSGTTAAAGGNSTMLIMSTALPMLAMALMTFFVQWVILRKQKQSHEANAKQQTERFEKALQRAEEKLKNTADLQRRIVRRENPGPKEITRQLKKRATTVWDRQPTDDDFLALRLGLGQEKLCVDVRLVEGEDDDSQVQRANKLAYDYSEVEGVPILTNLAQLGTVGVRGRRPSDSLYMTFNMVMHLVAHHSPDEVYLYIISHRDNASEMWSWSRWLPHTDALHHLAGMELRLSFSPATDEPVLLHLGQELRRRAERGRNENGHGLGNQDAHLVIILDRAPDLRGHQIIQQALSHSPQEEENRLRTSIIFIEDPLPAQVNGMIVVQNGEVDYRETWASDANQKHQRGSAELMNVRHMEQLARNMAPLRTIDSFNASGGALPSSVRLVEILGAKQANEINLSHYYERRYNPKTILDFPLGLNVDRKNQIISLRDRGRKGWGSHAILAGGTGGGKSITLQSLVLSLAATHSPRYLNFVLADFKAGASELAKLRELPHVAGFVTDLKPAYVERFRLALDGEIERRKNLFAATPQTLGQQITNIYDYNELCPDDPLPHLVLVIDEFHKARQLNEKFQATMDNGVAAQGRALGMHLVLSTQKAEDFGSVMPNIEIKMSMRMNRAEDSKAIFKREEAFTMLKRPGQAYVQSQDASGVEIFEMFQAARADTDHLVEGEVSTTVHDKFTISRLLPDGRRDEIYKHQPEEEKKEEVRQLLPTDADVLVDYIAEYCADSKYPPTRQICLDPLPQSSQLPLGELLATEPVFHDWVNNGEKQHSQRLKLPLAMLDLPAQQKQIVHTIDLNEGDGNLLVVGPQASGKNMLLRSLVWGLAQTHSPDDINFYFITQGAHLNLFADLPHCGGVIHYLQAERLKRLLKHLKQVISERHELLGTAQVDSLQTLRERDPNTPLPSILVIIEAYSPIRQQYEDLLSEFQTLASGGKQADVHLVMANTSINDIHVNLRNNLKQKIALGLRNRTDYLDVLNKRVEPTDEIEGRGYLLFEQEAYECQVCAPISAQGVLTSGIEARKEMQESIAQMNNEWKGTRPHSIEELPKHIFLPELWEKQPLVQMNFLMRHSEAIGLYYDDLRPLYLELNTLETTSLIVGPQGSGKSEFLVSLCCALVKRFSPEELRILILTMDSNSPLRHLRRLPHITIPKTKPQMEIALADLAKTVRLYKEQQNEMDVSWDDTSTMMNDNPKFHALILIDGLQSILNGQTSIMTHLNELEKTGGETTCRFFVTDIGSNLANIYSNRFQIGSFAQNMFNYKCGIVFSVEHTELNTVGASVSGNVTSLHRHKIGTGRGFFIYQGQAKVIQFGTMRQEDEEKSDKDAYKERLKSFAAEVVSMYPSTEPGLAEVQSNEAILSEYGLCETV